MNEKEMLPFSRLAARVEERLLAPARLHSGRSRTLFVVLVCLVLAIHAVLLAWFLTRDRKDALAMARATEVPVEVVVEPPKPPPAKPPPPPPPAKKDAAKKDAAKPDPAGQEAAMEKPATSAPRAPSKDPVETRTSKAKTEAPKAAAPPRAGVPPTAEKPGAAPEPPAAPNAKVATLQKREDDRRDAEALDRAQPKGEDRTKDQTTMTPRAVPTPTTEAARTMAGLLDLPNYSFAAATQLAPFPPGTEDNRYLAVVYGMVMGKNPYLGSAAARRGESGTVSVTFVVEPSGQVRSETIRTSSGFADLDSLAITAVRTAAPFPPPPGSGAQQLIATMSFGPH